MLSVETRDAEKITGEPVGDRVYGVSCGSGSGGGGKKIPWTCFLVSCF